MATFGTLNPTTNTVDSDDYLVRQGGIDYKQDRETLAAGVANARYIATVDYDAGSVITGSDGYIYKANTANGPSSTAVDPVGDTTGVWFSQFRALKGAPSATDNSQEGYTFSLDGDTGLFATGGTAGSGSDLELYIDNVSIAKFTSADVNLAASGYYKMPSGLIIQWGVGTTSNAGTVNNLPITFPNANFIVTQTHTGVDPSEATGSGVVSSSGLTTSAFTSYNSGATTPASIFYIAIGH